MQIPSQLLPGYVYQESSPKRYCRDSNCYCYYAPMTPPPGPRQNSPAFSQADNWQQEEHHRMAYRLRGAQSIMNSCYNYNQMFAWNQQSMFNHRPDNYSHNYSRSTIIETSDPNEASETRHNRSLECSVPYTMSRDRDNENERNIEKEELSDENSLRTLR